MAIPEAMDMVLRLRFDAAICDHVAKKATNRREKAAAKADAAALRERARLLECADDVTSTPNPVDPFSAI